ncbi:tail tape measure protein [Parasphingopyxis algicola]|uniref:tail tape measure protein n=1 Tax=Parasphingopyxis algicola TaxID=2026624 RepID=UPI0015A307BE|nr:tail tape measure protein [Parasphingopyxis algicola]QLC23660.1 tail tape measure protein [Parasphingopyxis algicola]
MNDDFEDEMIRVRADTQAFRNDVTDMRRTLADGLGGAADMAGRRIESALLRAVRTGKLGFDDLKRTALAMMNDIARAAIQGGLGSIFAGGGKGGGGLLSLGTQLASAFLGVPGRAAGGPVSPGRAYRVGESGPELFVPTASGRVEPMVPGEAGREVRVTINLNTPQGAEPEALTRSGRQLARELRRALERSV